MGRRVRTWAAPAVLAVMLAYPFPHFDFLRSPNELSRLYQVRALVDSGALHVDAQVARAGPVGDLSEAGGHRYPNKAPGISFAGALVYGLWKAAAGDPGDRGLLLLLRWSLCVLPTLLVLRPLRRYAARVSGDTRAAEASILVYVFGTLALPYSLLFFSHQLSANLAIGGFLALQGARRSPRAPALRVLGGLLAGYAVVTEYTLLPVSVLLTVYGVATASRRLEAMLEIAAGALPCALLLGAYHEAAYGSPFATGYRYVENQTFAAWHAQGLMGLTWPRLSSLAGNLLSPARGLLAFSPALALAFWGLAAHRREVRADGRLGLAVTAFYLLVAAAFLYEAWGWMLGPRHLAPLMPFLVTPLACALATLRRRAHRGAAWNLATGAAAGLAAASILVNGLCTAVFPHVPEEFSAALAHLAWPLVRTGHLPWNAAELALGRPALWTWLPWCIGLGAIALTAAGRILERPRWWPSVTLGALALTGFVALLFVAAPAETAREHETRAWIERSWEPPRGPFIDIR
jgi:hypothetical protein